MMKTCHTNSYLKPTHTKARANENWALPEHQNYDFKNVNTTTATLIKIALKIVY